MPRFILSVLLLLFVGTIVNAEQISLKNGDRLSGAIVSMDGKKLVLKTTYEGEVSIEWDSVEQFTSDQPLVVITVDKRTVTGTVKSEGTNYVVTTPPGSQTIAKSDIAGMRSLAAQAAMVKPLLMKKSEKNCGIRNSKNLARKASVIILVSRGSQRGVAEPPSVQVLTHDERSIEIPGLAADLMVQARITTGDELKFFRHIVYLQGRTKGSLVKIGHVTILFG